MGEGPTLPAPTVHILPPETLSMIEAINIPVLSWSRATNGPRFEQTPGRLHCGGLPQHLQSLSDQKWSAQLLLARWERQLLAEAEIIPFISLTAALGASDTSLAVTGHIDPDV